MISDKVKKRIMGISVIAAALLFLWLYLSYYGYSYAEDGNDDTAVTKSEMLAPMKNSSLKENKYVYSEYEPGGISKIYINVFPTLAADGKEYGFSDIDMVSIWNKDFNPVLDANVQFVGMDEEPKEKSIGSPNATIRVRGNPGAPLKSYRVKLVEGANGYEGQMVLNLDKNTNDPSRIANKLAHDLIKDLDNMSGFRTSFFEVYIRDDSAESKDGEFHSFGLYTHIEQPNRAYLKSHGLDENGTIYRAENFTFTLVPQIKNTNDPYYDKEALEEVLAIREGSDHSKLIRMLQDVNNDSKGFEEVFHTYFNEENYLTWLSVNILLGNTDAMSSGFLLYSPSNSTGFYLLPWDFDGIFRWMDDDSGLPDMYECINSVVLHRKYLALEGSKEKLKAKLKELVEDEFSPGRVKSLVKQYEPVLLEAMSRYPDSVLLPVTLNEQLARLRRIDESILMNYEYFLRHLD